MSNTTSINSQSGQTRYSSNGGVTSLPALQYKNLRYKGKKPQASALIASCMIMPAMVKPKIAVM